MGKKDTSLSSDENQDAKFTFLSAGVDSSASGHRPKKMAPEKFFSSQALIWSTLGQNFGQAGIGWPTNFRRNLCKKKFQGFYFILVSEIRPSRWTILEKVKFYHFSTPRLSPTVTVSRELWILLEWIWIWGVLRGKNWQCFWTRIGGYPLYKW